MAPAPGAAVIGLPLLLIVPLLAVPGAKARETFGEAGCRCVDPWAAVEGSLSSSPQYDAENDCVRGTDGFCYPTGYGASECRAWDDGQSCSDPERCSSKWCFVDPASCDRRHVGREIVSGSPFEASYATCGDLPPGYAEDVAVALTGRPVRVSFPHLDGPPFLVTTDDGAKVGSYPSFMLRVLRDLGVQMEYVPVSEGSKDKFLSPWTACYHDISLGSTDVCIANFWSTPSRRAMPGVVMSQELTQDKFLLISRKEEALSFLGVIQYPFAPFTWQLWLLILAVWVGSAIYVQLLEGDSAQGSLSHDPYLSSVLPDGGSDLDSLSDSDLDGAEGKGEAVAPVPLTVRLMDNFYMTAMSFVNASMGFVPITVAGRIFNFSLGFFFLFLVASYTANLAKTLVAAEVRGTVDSLESAISAGIMVCGFEAIETQMVALYPDLSTLYLPKADGAAALEGLHSNECEIAIVDEVSWENAIRGLYDPDDPSRHCDKIDNKVVYTLGNAIPFNADLATALSWAVSKYHQKGWFDEEDRIARNTFWPPRVCNAAAQGGDEGLGVIDVAGLFILLGVTLVASFALWAVGQCRHRRAVRKGTISPQDRLTNVVKLTAQQQDKRHSTLGTAGKELAARRQDMVTARSSQIGGHESLARRSSRGNIVRRQSGLGQSVLRSSKYDTSSVSGARVTSVGPLRKEIKFVNSESVSRTRDETTATPSHAQNPGARIADGTGSVEIAEASRQAGGPSRPQLEIVQEHPAGDSGGERVLGTILAPATYTRETGT